MSFAEGFFGDNEFSPKPKRRNGNGNGKRRNGNGNGKRRGFANGGRSAKESAMGFESPGFFEGLKGNGDISKVGGGGIPKIDNDIGVGVPELGEGFNSRIGNIGQGFTESVDPFKIGFTDILTGNGRTGQIIGAGADLQSSGLKRGRGRPKGTTKKALKARKKAKKGFDFDTSKEVRQLRKAGKTDQIRSTTVGGLLKESVRGGVPTGSSGTIRSQQQRRDSLEFQESVFDGGQVAEGTAGTRERREKEIDEEQVDRFNVAIALEREQQQDQGMDEESLLEDEEEDPGMEEDMNGEGGGLPALTDDSQTENRERIDRISREETEDLR